MSRIKKSRVFAQMAEFEAEDRALTLLAGNAAQINNATDKDPYNV